MTGLPGLESSRGVSDGEDNLCALGWDRTLDSHFLNSGLTPILIPST